MNVYRATNGRWLVYNNGIKSDYFSTQAEALDMSEKIEFAEKTVELSEALISVIKELPTVEKLWSLNNYLATMTDLDIASTGKTKAEVEAFITFIENFNKFLTADTITPAAYQDTLYNLLKGL